MLNRVVCVCVRAYVCVCIYVIIQRVILVYNKSGCIKYLDAIYEIKNSSNVYNCVFESEIFEMKLINFGFQQNKNILIRFMVLFKIICCHIQAFFSV